MKDFEISNSQKFAAMIRKLADDNDLNIVEAITSYCEDNDMDMADIIPILDSNLRESIRVCAIDNNMVLGIPKTPKLF